MVPTSSPLGWWVDAPNLGENYEWVLWERWEMGASTHPHPLNPQKIRFDAGSGMATIRHPTALRLGEYHTVRLLRNLTWGSLGLDGHPAVNGTSQVSLWSWAGGVGVRVLEVVPTLLCLQGKFQGLDLNEELYLGGYPDIGAVAKTGLSRGFMGE